MTEGRENKYLSRFKKGVDPFLTGMTLGIGATLLGQGDHFTGLFFLGLGVLFCVLWMMRGKGG